jgi:hypothetical protein
MAQSGSQLTINKPTMASSSELEQALNVLPMTERFAYAARYPTTIRYITQLLRLLELLPLDDRLNFCLRYTEIVTSSYVLDILNVLPDSTKYAFAVTHKASCFDQLPSVITKLPEQHRLAFAVLFESLPRHVTKAIVAALPANDRFQFCSHFKNTVADYAVTLIEFISPDQRFDFIKLFPDFPPYCLKEILATLPYEERLKFCERFEKIIKDQRHIHLVDLIPENQRMLFITKFSAIKHHDLPSYLKSVTPDEQLELANPFIKKTVQESLQRAQQYERLGSHSMQMKNLAVEWFKKSISILTDLSYLDDQNYYPFISKHPLFKKTVNTLLFTEMNLFSGMFDQLGSIYCDLNNEQYDLELAAYYFRISLLIDPSNVSALNHRAALLVEVLPTPIIAVFYHLALATQDNDLLLQAMCLDSAAIMQLWHNDRESVFGFINDNSLEMISRLINTTESVINIPETHKLKYLLGSEALEKQDVVTGLTYYEQLNPIFLTDVENFEVAVFVYSHFSIEHAFPFFMQAIHSGHKEAERMLGQITLAKHDLPFTQQEIELSVVAKQCENIDYYKSKPVAALFFKPALNQSNVSPQLTKARCN